MLGETNSSPILSLADVVSALRLRGRLDEVINYGVFIPLTIELTHGIPFEEVLDMSINDISLLLMMPPKPAGYDLFYWGRATIANH